MNDETMTIEQQRLNDFIEDCNQAKRNQRQSTMIVLLSLACLFFIMAGMH